VTRHPSVTAAAFATLAELSGGRALLGISIGDSALKTLGKGLATRANLCECIEQVRALLAGESIEYGNNIEARLAYASAHRVPIYIAASGPRMLRLAGALGDGVVLMNGVDVTLVSAANALVDEGARQAGRQPSAIRRVVWAACHTSSESPERSIQACRYNVARTILRNLPGPLDARTRAIAEQVRACYDYAQHGSTDAEFATLIPDDLVARFTFAGTPEHVTQAIVALQKIGIDEVALAIPRNAAGADRNQVLQGVAAAALTTY
jgi:5,10-methylenetetrahydromethanopterin reductase